MANPNAKAEWNRKYYYLHHEEILARRREEKRKAREARLALGLPLPARKPPKKKRERVLTPEEQRQRNIELTSLWWGGKRA